SLLLVVLRCKAVKRKGRRTGKCAKGVRNAAQNQVVCVAAAVGGADLCGPSTGATARCRRTILHDSTGSARKICGSQINVTARTGCRRHRCSRRRYDGRELAVVHKRIATATAVCAAKVRPSTEAGHCRRNTRGTTIVLIVGHNEVADRRTTAECRSDATAGHCEIARLLDEGGVA